MTVAVRWTRSRIVANSQLTPQPAEPHDASEPSLWSHFALFLQQTCLNRNPTASTSSASWFPPRIFLAYFMASFCVLSLLFGGKTELQRAERWAGSNCRPASWSIGIAVTAMKPQLTSADKCDCACVTVCVLVLNITARIVD